MAKAELCDDCLAQGYHERVFSKGKKYERLYKFYCCSVCGSEQYFKRCKDGRKSICNKCTMTKSRAKRNHMLGYAGTDAKGNPLV